MSFQYRGLKAKLERHMVTPEEIDEAVAAVEPRFLEVLEKAYGILIPTLMKLENKQLEDVKTYGEQYLKYFPEGPNAVNIRRIMDDAAKESALK